MNTRQVLNAILEREDIDESAVSMFNFHRFVEDPLTHVAEAQSLGAVSILLTFGKNPHGIHNFIHEKISEAQKILANR